MRMTLTEFIQYLFYSNIEEPNLEGQGPDSEEMGAEGPGEERLGAEVPDPEWPGTEDEIEKDQI